jgi:arylsulfatase A
MLNRRDFLAASGASLAAAGRMGGAERSAKPNILLILADDVGAAELSCYGNPEIRTPNLDRLAGRGVRFETCYVAPLCSPTRVSLMSGKYGFRTGWYDLYGRPWAPRPGSPQFDVGSLTTFADVAKSRGYATALSGKWQLSGKLPTQIYDCGFDEYCMWAYAHNLPEGVTHPGVERAKVEIPTPARYWHPSIVQNGKYVPTTPDDYGPDIHANFMIDFIRRNRKGPFLAYHPMCLPHGPIEPVPDLEHPGRKVEGSLKKYIEYADHLVGRILKTLDDLNLRERTAVIFLGDNGTAKAGKAEVTERGVRVPLIASYPGVFREGVVSRELASGVDIFPLIAELSGAKLDPKNVIDGVSLLPTLRGERVTHRDWVFSYLQDKRMLRDKRWLLEGDGRFFDCGESRNGKGYTDVTNSRAPEVLAARKRFEEILKKLPAPKRPGDVAEPGRG